MMPFWNACLAGDGNYHDSPETLQLYFRLE
jgi:hypothetical protein